MTLDMCRRIADDLARLLAMMPLISWRSGKFMAIGSLF
jgi:hypothetical protein